MERNIIQEILDKNPTLTLHSLAKNIGYDVAVVSRVKNRVQKMSHRMAFKISEVYKIDLSEIMIIEKVE